MINEFEFFHGAVLCKLVHDHHVKTIVTYPTDSNASYVINENLGIYIKYSTKRLSPWAFTFSKQHQDEILDMKNTLGQVYIMLVCNNDGVVCLEFDELKIILDNNHEEFEWVSASRKAREKYTIKGSDGRLRLKVGINDFEKIISE